MDKWKEDSTPTPVGSAVRPPPEVIDRETLARWLVQTCEAFGTRKSTAYQVAGKFIEQLEHDEERSDEPR